MKLKKIYFDAFKSLLDKELDINQKCIGFVGTNESGKSNILAAINVLGGDRRLTETDTPKMAINRSPSLRFVFSLTESESKVISDNITQWIDENTLVKPTSINVSNLQVTLNVA